METYRSEEEQIDAIKKWWQVNGSNILIGIGLAILIVVGWQFWQDQKRATGEGASVMYGELLQAAELASKGLDDAEKNKENLATLKHLGNELKTQYETSEYAVFAALMLAKQYVNANDADSAEAELRWATSHGASRGVELVAQLRLARVLMMKDQLDEALALINGLDIGAQSAAFDEVKGDIYVRLGKIEEARAAYSKALNANTSKGGTKPIVKMKYDNLAVVK